MYRCLDLIGLHKLECRFNAPGRDRQTTSVHTLVSEPKAIEIGNEVGVGVDAPSVRRFPAFLNLGRFEHAHCPPRFANVVLVLEATRKRRTSHGSAREKFLF